MIRSRLHRLALWLAARTRPRPGHLDCSPDALGRYWHGDQEAYLRCTRAIG